MAWAVAGLAENSPKRTSTPCSQSARRSFSARAARASTVSVRLSSAWMGCVGWRSG